jgi:hypothetical protein
VRVAPVPAVGVVLRGEDRGNPDGDGFLADREVSWTAHFLFWIDFHDLFFSLADANEFMEKPQQARPV